MPSHVFLSYVIENIDLVRKLKDALKDNGINAWRDGDNLGAGQRWDLEIPHAIDKASFFIACFSAESEAKESSEMRVEIIQAIRVLQKKGPGRDWLIPVKLSACHIPYYEIEAGKPLSNIQWIELFRDWEGSVGALVARLRGQPPNRKAARQKGTTNRLRVIGQENRSRKPSAPTIAASSPAVHSPGGPVPSDAIPYVSRAHDKLILEALQQASFNMLVRGPSQCGKSTALSLLERKAHEVGIETAWFDPQPYQSYASLPLESDADAVQTHALSELLQATWGLRQPRRGPINTFPKLHNWMIEELAPTASKPRLLILDDLVTLGRAAAERWLSLFVRAMVNQRATRGVNVSIAVGMTDHFGAYFARKLMLISSTAHWRPMMIMGWLDQADVVKLWRELRVREATDLDDESVLGDVFVMFRGQPYLTHAALIDRGFRSLVWEWISERSPDSATAIRHLVWYKRHVSAIRLALCGPSYEQDSEALRLVASFRGACEARSPEERLVIEPDHGLFLTTVRLLDHLGNPALEIYRLIAEDL